jgi:hypothetical protein
VLLPALLAQLHTGAVSGHLRAASSVRRADDPQEVESERFVFLIKRQLVHAERLAELIWESSSIADLRPYADGMAFGG